MPIKVTCQCGQRFAAKERLAGRKVKCPKCGSLLKIPQPEQSKPDQPNGPEPGKQPGAMADLLHEGGMDGAAAPNVCPGCRTVMPQGAIVCIHCGYNQKSGQKMETEAAPAGPPPTRPVSRAPSGGPARKRGALALLATASLLLYWGALLVCAALVVKFAGVFLPMPRVILALAALGGFVGSLLHIAGWILCLTVPRQSGAKGLIVTAVILQLIVPLIGVAPAPRGLPLAVYVVLDLADSLLWLTAIVVFLFFLKRLGRYLKRSDVADEAQFLIYGVLGLVAFILIGPAVTTQFVYVIALLLKLATCVVVIGAAIYLLIRYLRLLEGLRHALLRASEA